MVDFDKLKPGSVVRLICGSPRMTVTHAAAPDRVEVLWWADGLGIQTDTFAVELLVDAHPVIPPVLEDARR